MVKKLQTYITIVGKPYEPNPSDYPGCNTLEEMRAADEVSFGECPDFVIDDPKAETKVEVRIVESEEE